jgi:hypothetical protein
MIHRQARRARLDGGSLGGADCRNFLLSVSGKQLLPLFGLSGLFLRLGRLFLRHLTVPSRG